MNITDALQVLDLSVPITKIGLKKAYREALMVWHPDRFAGNKELQQKAASKTYLINEAYSLLSKIAESGYPYRKPFDTNTAAPEKTTPDKSDSKEGSMHAPDNRGFAASTKSNQDSGPRSAAPQEQRRANPRPRSLLDRIALVVAAAAAICLIALIIHVWPTPSYSTATKDDSAKGRMLVAEPHSDEPHARPAKETTSGERLRIKALELLHDETSNNIEAVKLFEEAATLGDAEAQYQLALAFTSGKGTLGVSHYAVSSAELRDKATKYIRMAAEQGHPKAQYLFGRDCYRGWGVPEDKSVGLRWLLKAAAQGEVEAQLELGDHFYFSDGADADKSAAFNWYLKAAKDGCAEAQQKTGDAYKSGVGVERDLGEAVKWYLLAAQKDNHNSKVWLGVAFEKGEGVAPDLVEAHKWYALAKAQRDIESAAELESSKTRSSLMRTVPKSYITGRGDCLGLTGIEPKLSETQIQESTRRQRVFLASTRQGTNSEFAVRGLPAAPASTGNVALGNESQTPKLESVEEQVEMGDAYYFGRGVSPDKQGALRWWLKAAERGDSGAQYNVGICYANGEGVKVSINEAVRWFELAASQGHSEAQYQLSVCYGTGNGVGKDLEEAARLSLLSAKQGNVNAQLNLGNCYNDGIGVARDEREAAKWYRLAANQGNADAQFYLGLAYGGGVGVPEDEVEAYKWYLLAANQDHKSAKKLLREYEASAEQVTAAKQGVAEFEQALAAKRAQKVTSSARPRKAKDAPPPMVEASELRHLPSDSRLSSGTVLVDKLAPRGGLGKLTLVNGLSEDAYVKIIQNDALAASFYVRGGATFTFDHLPDGAYAVLFCTGFGWDSIKRDFERGRHARRYDSPITFETRKTREANSIITSTDVMKLTLHAVPDGNARTSDLSLDEFDRY